MVKNVFVTATQPIWDFILTTHIHKHTRIHLLRNSPWTFLFFSLFFSLFLRSLCIRSFNHHRSKSRSVDHGLAAPFANLDSLRSTVEGRFDSVERLSKGLYNWHIKDSFGLLRRLGGASRFYDFKPISDAFLIACTTSHAVQANDLSNKLLLQVETIEQLLKVMLIRTNSGIHLNKWNLCKGHTVFVFQPKPAHVRCA